MGKYSQLVILRRLSFYLYTNNRDLTLDEGYCHGFTLLWLYHMSQNSEDSFYSITHKIADCRTTGDFQKIEPEIETTLAHLEWLQNSKKYMHSVNQLDVDDLLELPRILSLSYQFTKQQFYHVLRKVIHPNELICLSGPSHTIGLYYRGNTYYLFDPNYENGKAKEFKNIHSLRNEIMQILVKEGSVKNKLLPIEINIMKSPTNECDATQQHWHGCDENKKSRILEMLLSRTLDIDQEGPAGSTSLHLAIEAGDYNAIKRLIDSGASTNHLGTNGWTPLQSAALHGKTSITRLLLRHGANPNLCDHRGISPLHVAAQEGEMRIVKLLIKNGAEITVANYSPIRLAVNNSFWEIAALLLANCRLQILPHKEIRLLKNKFDYIKQAALKIQPTLNEKQKLQLTRNMNELTSSFFDKYRFFSRKKAIAANTDTITAKKRIVNQ